MWRALVRRFDLLTGGRKRNILRAILNPNGSKIENFQANLNTWQLLVARYEKKKKRPLDEDLKISGLEALAPVELEQHLLLNATRLGTYEAARSELVTYCESKTGVRIKDDIKSRAGDREQLDAFYKGKGYGSGGKAFGVGKGTDSGGHDNRTCFTCGARGHFSFECPKGKGHGNKSKSKFSRKGYSSVGKSKTGKPGGGKGKSTKFGSPGKSSFSGKTSFKNKGKSKSKQKHVS